MSGHQSSAWSWGHSRRGRVNRQHCRLSAITQLFQPPELYGTGHPEGLIAPESANNGVTSGTLVPLLVLGIPGGATAAIMLVVMQFHGVSFGPSLFEDEPKVGYGMFMAMAVSYVVMVFTILPLSRYTSHDHGPPIYLAPMIISFTLVGGFVPREYMFDMYLALGFGVLGYIARRTGYHVAAILIGVILGPLFGEVLLVVTQEVRRRHHGAFLFNAGQHPLGGLCRIDHLAHCLWHAAQTSNGGTGRMKRELEWELERNIRRLGHLDIAGGGQVVVQEGYAYVGHMDPPMGTSIIE